MIALPIFIIILLINCNGVPHNFTGKRIKRTTFSDGTVEEEVENYENGKRIVNNKFSKLYFTHMFSTLERLFDSIKNIITNLDYKTIII